MNSSPLLPVGTRLGNYEVTELIGEGGMGTVYAAVHLGLGKRVAVKTLRSELAADMDVRARFLREGKAAAAVRHPNVVDVDDVGIHEDTPYLVMELLEGEDLRAWVTRAGRLSVPQIVDIIIPVLLAMGEAHRAGVVHRDLKPDNVFLARGSFGVIVPKVLDFGISKLKEAQSLSLTSNNALLGTPYYMSPEQAGSARDVDARSDLYSIGVILYHCITGRVPFAGTSLAQVLGQIMLAPPIPLRESIPDVPEAFEHVVLRAMEKVPAARYQDALAFGCALLPFASARAQVGYAPALGLEVGDTLFGTDPLTGARPAPAAVSGTGTLSGMAHSVARTRSQRSVPPWAAAIVVVVAILVTYRLVTASQRRQQSFEGPPTVAPIPVAPASGALAPLDPQPTPTEPRSIPTEQAHAIPAAPIRPTPPLPERVDRVPSSPTPSRDLARDSAQLEGKARPVKGRTDRDLARGRRAQQPAAAVVQSEAPTEPKPKPKDVGAGDEEVWGDRR